MFLSHDLGLGLGLSTVFISIGLRLCFLKVNLSNVKNSKINRMLFVEKKEINNKLKEVKVINYYLSYLIKSQNFFFLDLEWSSSTY